MKIPYIDSPSGPVLTTCCACGREVYCPFVVLIRRRAPSPGTGWGCLACRASLDGGITLLCRDCVNGGVRPWTMLDGPVPSPGRVPIRDLAPLHEHAEGCQFESQTWEPSALLLPRRGQLR